jgi:hypothetical protein
LRSSTAGKPFTGGEPPGEGRYTTQQGLVLWSWAPDTLFLLLNRCWGSFFEVYPPGNTKMRTYFVFSHIYAISIDAEGSRR